MLPSFIVCSVTLPKKEGKKNNHSSSQFLRAQSGASNDIFPQSTVQTVINYEKQLIITFQMFEMFAWKMTKAINQFTNNEQNIFLGLTDQLIR